MNAMTRESRRNRARPVIRQQPSLTPRVPFEEAEPALLQRCNSLGRQAPKHRIDTARRQLRPAIEPPDQHGHVSANDILDDKFARDDVRGILADARAKLIAHQTRKYLANLAKADGAAAAADERP